MARTPNSKGRKRRWRTAIGVCGLVALGIVAAPFLFTNQIVRYYIDHSPYQRFHPRFKTARLHLLGGVTLDDVTLEDIAESAGKPLVHAGRVRIDFQWTQVFSSRFRALDAEDAQLTIRDVPGAGITLRRLLPGGGARPLEQWARSLSTLPLDQLLVAGTVQLEDQAALAKVLQLGPSPLPFRMALTTPGAGASGGTARDLILVLGETGATASLTEPVLAARLHLKSPPGATPQIAIDTLTASNLSADIPRALLPAWFAPLPRRDYSAHADRVQITGNLTLGPDTLFDGTFDLHDAAARSTDDGLPLVLDRFSLSTHAAGPLTQNPLRDLTFTKMTAGFDLAQIDAWRVTRATVNIAIGPAEIEVTDFEAAALDGTLVASGALDLQTGTLIHGNIALQGASAQRILGRIAESTGRPLPFSAEGQMTFRWSLAEGETDHSAGRIDVVCPAQLKLLPAEGAAFLPQPLMAAVRDGIVVNNLSLGGTVAWSGRWTDLPEISHGRLGADDLTATGLAPLWGETAAMVLGARSVSGSFSADKAAIHLDDLSAALAGETQFSGSGSYDLRSATISHAKIAVTGIEGAALAGLLPGDMGVNGRFDFAAEFTREPGPLLTATLAGSQQTGIKLPVSIGGSVGIVGKPVLFVRGWTAAKAGYDLDALSIRGLSAFKIDGAAMRYLRDEVAARGGDDTPAGRMLERFKDGIVGSAAELAARGKLEFTANGPSFTGDVSVGGLDAGTVQEAAQETRLTGLSGKATLATAANADAPPSLSLTAGEAKFDKLTFDGRTLSAASATFAATQGALTIPALAFQMDEGTFKGDAAAAESAQLDRLRLTFTTLNLSPATANLFPLCFTAEGKASGVIELSRDAANKLAGNITLTADSAGKLSFARDAAAGPLATVEKAAAADLAATGAPLPPNFDQLVADQLANYPYTSGRATIADGPAGLTIALDYPRQPLKPLDPASIPPATAPDAANVAVNLKGVTLAVPDTTIADVLAKYFGLSDVAKTASPTPATQQAFP